MTTVSLTMGAYLARVAVPVAGVFASVVLLAAAALAILTDRGTDGMRHGLFAAGVLSWMFGIGWGVFVNAKPLPASSQG